MGRVTSCSRSCPDSLSALYLASHLLPHLQKHFPAVHPPFETTSMDSAVLVRPWLKQEVSESVTPRLQGGRDHDMGRRTRCVLWTAHVKGGEGAGAGGESLMPGSGWGQKEPQTVAARWGCLAGCRGPCPRRGQALTAPGPRASLRLPARGSRATHRKGPCSAFPLEGRSRWPPSKLQQRAALLQRLSQLHLDCVLKERCLR